MQITSLLSRQKNNEGCSCNTLNHLHDHDFDESEHTHEHHHDHEHVPVRITLMLTGLVLVINSFIIEHIIEKGSMVAALSAMIGTIVLAFPIVTTALKDFKLSLIHI